MKKSHALIGQEAIGRTGWIGAHRYLLLRSVSQFGFLALFLLGPWYGFWIVKGTLAGSMTQGLLPLTDPLVLLQSLLAGHWPELTGVLGALIVVATYALIGARVYCSWACPINPVTDAANWVHRKLGLPNVWQPKRSARLWRLGTVLVVFGLTGTIVWEVNNPVTTLPGAFCVAWVLGADRSSERRVHPSCRLPCRDLVLWWVPLDAGDDQQGRILRVLSHGGHQPW